MFSSFCHSASKNGRNIFVKWLRLGAASVYIYTYICVCVYLFPPLIYSSKAELDKKPFPPHTLCTHPSQCRITPHTSRLFFYWGTQEDCYIPKLKIILPKDEHRCLGSPHQYSTEKSTHLEKTSWTLVKKKSMIILISFNQYQIKKEKSTHSIPNFVKTSGESKLSTKTNSKVQHLLIIQRK